MSCLLRIVVIVLTIIAVPTLAWAQTFPARTVTLITNFAPGSPQDTIIRAMAEHASKDFGQPVVVENKPGGGATLGPAVMAATAKPDGTMVSSLVSTLVLVPQMQKVAFDPFKDFTYLLQVGSFPLGVAVKADSSFKSWADVETFAKANPGVVTFGTPGAGTNIHLATQFIAMQAGIRLTHVPFNGAMAIIPAVLGDHVMLQASGMEWKPMVEAGQMRLLVMLTAQRHRSFPDTPTIGEFGYKYEFSVPFGFGGPKNMDAAAERKWHDALKKAAEAPNVLDLFQKFDIDPSYASGPDFRRNLEAIALRMKPVIQDLGLGVKP